MKKSKFNPKDKKKPFDYGSPQDLVRLPPSRTDPEGWYTAHPINEWDTPVQAQDDLF